MEEHKTKHSSALSVFRKIRKLILWLTGVIVFFIFSLLSLLFIYEDEVKTAIVNELNLHLNAEVKIAPKNIDLTIIRSFPDCSIRFTDLLMLEAIPAKKRDTLLFAGQLSLHFNIKDLWNKNYTIQKIKLHRVVAKPQVLKNGKTNYEFWKKEKTTANNTDNHLAFNLKHISIENARVNYRDKKNLFKTTFTIQQLFFSGRFSDDNFDLESEASLFIKEIVQEKTSYLKDKHLNYQVKLNVNDDSYRIEKAKVQLNQLAIALSGKFNYSDQLELLEMEYQAPGLDIFSLLSLLPDRFKENIHDYESSGSFYAGGTIRYLNKNSYSIVSDFGIKDGKITYKPTATTATDVNLEGYLNYSSQASVLHLKNIHLNLEHDEIKGSCLVNNFKDPSLRVSANASVKLENLLNFWPVDTISSAKGNLSLNTEIEGQWTSLKDQTFSDKVKLALDATVSDIEVKFKHDKKTYKVEKCAISARERHIEVKDLKLKRGSSDMKLNGKIPGVFNYIMNKDAPLIISGSLYSNYLNMEDFITEGKSASGKSNNALIPENVSFKLNAAILKFSFGKFNAGAITGEIEIKNQKVLLSTVKFETMQGDAEIEAFADNSKGKLDVVIQSHLKNINITQLFSELNNFGQDNLTDRHLKGTAAATIDFSGSWSNNLEPDLNSIHSKCNLLIEHGELNDYKPLLSLSKFVDVDELRRIKFSSLESAVEIKNSQIILPRTAIKNSALNIDIWGTHWFDNRIDYHIQLIINQYLAKKRKKKESEFGPVENDPENRRSAFILMKGTVDDPDIRFDMQGLKQKIKMDVAREKKSMKQLLKEEWNLFKKDTSLKQQKSNEQVFEFEKPATTPIKKTLGPKKKEEEEDF